MNKIRLFILSLGMLFATSCFAEAIVVIVNANNSATLSLIELKNIYSDIQNRWPNGEKVKLYDLPVKNPAREIFSQKVLGISALEAAREWANRKITNTAKNPPKTKKEKLVAALVAKNPNAVGYVSAAAVKGNKNIKVVFEVN